MHFSTSLIKAEGDRLTAAAFADSVRWILRGYLLGRRPSGSDMDLLDQAIVELGEALEAARADSPSQRAQAALVGRARALRQFDDAQPRSADARLIEKTAQVLQKVRRGDSADRSEVEPVVALYAERNRVALRAVRELRSEHSTIGRTQRRA